MSNNCALCNTELTSMDTLLGANKLSDGNVLCNKCLNNASNINDELLYKLNAFSIDDINEMLHTGKKEKTQILAVTEQNLPAAIDSGSRQISKEVYKRRHQKIKHELEMLNASLSMFTKGEIKELPYLISEDEKIIAITDAQFVNTLAAGILVATPMRLISVSKAMFGAAKINEYPNEIINAVSFVTDPRSPIIKLHLDERVVEFECFMDKDDAEKFYDKIKTIYNNPKEQSSKQIDTVKGVSVSSEEVFDQLEKLGKLRENGILTDAEFAEQKKKLLEQLK
ncbi:PH domain-containing protein [Chryseobacterium sp. WG14]|uniref:PH domain-containing protein n=1 Tax=Chryseobacterium sp. WG14 TaxID=2926909 RepID=UPI00211E7ED3|nr:PH domain-containing protein [Chryseobacterium sp. WG14]MCQ9639019.1 PH domain-containing protein [Chryseobacterium sp. WG14]